jgi:hypothetical protein
VEGKSGKDLSVILTFDEIALTPQPNFTQESLAIDGFVNLSIPVYNRDEMEHHDEVDAPRPEPLDKRDSSASRSCSGFHGSTATE